MKSLDKKNSFNFKILLQVFTYVKPYKKYFYFSIALACLLAILSPVRPYLIQLTVDSSTFQNTNLPNWLSFFSIHKNHGLLHMLWSITIIQVLFIVIETLIRFAFSYITAWLGQNVIKDIRQKVFSVILQKPLAHFDTTPIGTLTTRTVNDIESINDIFSDGFIPIISDLLTIFLTVITMFYVDWKLSFVALIPLPIIIIATNKFKKSVNKSFVNVRNAVSNLNSFVQEHITGMYITQAFTAEEREFKKFEKINAHHRDANIKAIFAYSVFFPIVELVLAISTALIVWWVSHLALSNQDNQMNFSGKIIAFVLYMNQIFRPLRILADKFNVLQMGMIAAERVLPYTIHDSNKNNSELSSNNSSNTHEKTIVFNNVWFAYKNENYVLKNINFFVKKGETLALVGSTGSGKTSIISLINKLYNIQKGNILIEGRDINDYSNNELRKKIGVVLQDVFLFSGSIIENITLRNDGISKEEVIRAAKLIGMHDFIMQLPNNYEYNVMERGNILSMGQRQLISFIRVLLYDPSILILDEATSSVDSESEALIEKAIATILKGRTSIIIAHRLSTITKANNIALLSNGEIKELGTHMELLDKKGLYYNLYHSKFEV